jgi:hypothetical protein
MALTTIEFATILADTSKRIEGDITWSEDEDHSPALEFTGKVHSDSGWPLFVRGSINPVAGCLTFTLILKSEGRIYALDMGKDHHNPQCTQVGEKHKHRWVETFRDKEAYAPDDITAFVSDPVSVWKQFCAEVGIIHDGKLAEPPTIQGELFL